MSLTDCGHSDAVTFHLMKAIRKQLEAFVSIGDFERFVFEADELDDTRSNVEVAFAIDRILRAIAR